MEPQTNPAAKTIRQWLPLTWLLVAVLGGFCAFALPFYFPLKQPVLSAAYQMGANNRAAEVSLALLSALVALAIAAFGYKAYVEAREPQDIRLTPACLWLGIAIVCLWTAGLGFIVARSNLFWGDEGYFLHQLRTGLLFHGVLYKTFEFPYGPALYYWPAAFITVLGQIGISFTAAYLLSLAVLQSLGIYLVYFVLNALPLQRWVRLVGFAGMTLTAMTPFLGINYAIFRFLFPMAAVVVLCRCTTVTRAAIVSFVGVIAGFLVSPELAISFAGAAFLYGIYRAWTTSKPWLLVSAAVVIGAVCFALFAGKSYFLTMGSIAKGGFNLLIQPMPHVLILLVALLAIAPIAVGCSLARRDRESGLLLTAYVASLGLLPAAMGRSDAIHLMMNGIGIYLLSLVAIQFLSPRAGKLWALAFITVCAITMGSNLKAYQPIYRDITHRSPENKEVDVTRLEADLNGQQVTTPANAPPDTIAQLSAKGLYRPGFYCGLVGVWDQAAEARIVAEMRESRYTLLPARGAESREPLDTSRFKQMLRLGYAYKEKHPPVIIGPVINAEIKQNWKPVDNFGWYSLYERVN